MPTISAVVASTFLTISVLIMYPSFQVQSHGAPSFTNNVIYHDTAFLNGGVNLVGIHTQPIIVHVGNNFLVRAVVFNNSPGTISFIAGPCDSSLSAKFDKNVDVKHVVRCLAAAQLVKLKPGEKTSVSGPSSGVVYQANTLGKTTTSVTFHYQQDNVGNGNVTRSFLFNIQP